MKGTWNISFFNIVKTIFISFEFAFTILMFIFYFLNVLPFDRIGKFFFEDSEIVKWITLAIPIGLFLASGRLQKALLQPESNNKILYNWPDYKKYRTSTYIALVFCFLPILPTFIFWARFEIYEEYDVGFFYILLNGISIISFISLYISHFEVKRILQKYSIEGSALS